LKSGFGTPTSKVAPILTSAAMMFPSGLRSKVPYHPGSRWSVPRHWSKSATCGREWGTTARRFHYASIRPKCRPTNFHRVKPWRALRQTPLAGKETASHSRAYPDCEAAPRYQTGFSGLRLLDEVAAVARPVITTRAQRGSPKVWCDRASSPCPLLALR
jgi:hypothetical protein